MVDGELIGLTVWYSESLDKNIIDLQLREMSSFLESKFEDTLSEEMKVIRSPGVRDTHIHCVFLVLDPLRLDTNIAAAQKAASSSTNGAFANGKSHPQSSTSPKVFSGLDEDLDLQVLRTLQGKTTVVPVISKADTITTAHMGNLKRAVWDSLKKANLDPLEALGLDDGDDDDVADSHAESPLVGRKHDSKRLDERDEDALLRTDGAGSPTSHPPTLQVATPPRRLRIAFLTCLLALSPPSRDTARMGLWGGNFHGGSQTRIMLSTAIS